MKVVPILLSLLAIQVSHAMQVVGYNAAKHDRFYSGTGKAILSGSIDWSGVGKCITAPVNQFAPWATMITRKHFLTCNHFSWPASKSVTFYKGNLPTSGTVTASVASIVHLGDDLSIGTLTADLPSDVAVYPILKAPIPLGQLAPLKLFMFGRGSDQSVPAVDQRIAFIEAWLSSPNYSGDYDGFGDSRTGRIESLVGLKTWSVPNDYASIMQIGDSGGPAFLTVNNTLVMVSVNGGPNNSVDIGHGYWRVYNYLSSNFPAYLSQLQSWAPPPWRPMEFRRETDGYSVSMPLLSDESVTDAVSDDPNMAPPNDFSPQYKVTGSNVEVRYSYIYHRVGTEIRFFDETAGTSVALSHVGSDWTASLPWINGHKYSYQSRYNYGGSTTPWSLSASVSFPSDGSSVRYYIKDALGRGFFRPVISKSGTFWGAELLGSQKLHVDGATTAYTPASTYISNPFLSAPVFKGRVSSMSGSSVIFDAIPYSTATLAANQFNLNVYPYVTHLAENLNTGDIAYISQTGAGNSTSGGSIEVEIPNFALATHTIVIRPVSTVGDIFGAYNEAGLYIAPEFMAGDVVEYRIPSSSEAPTFYPYIISPDQGLFDTFGSDVQDYPIRPLSAVQVHRKLTLPLEWRVHGHAKRSENFIRIYTNLTLYNDNFIGSPQGAAPSALAASINSLNIPVDQDTGMGYWGFRSGADFSGGDQILFGTFLSGTVTPATPIFYRNTGVAGWYFSNGTTSASAWKFPSGNGFNIKQQYYNYTPFFIWKTPEW